METPPTLTAIPWKPTRSTSIWMTVLSTVIVLVAGVLAFVLAFRGREGTITFDLVGVVIAVGIIAVHIAGCIGGWFLIAVTLRAPRGSLVEDMKDGLVVFTPASR